MNQWSGDQVFQLIRQGNLQDAERLITETLEASPNHIQARLAKTRLLAASGRYEDAEDLARSLATAHPDNPWTANATLDVLVSAGDRAGAEAFLLEDVLPKFVEEAWFPHGLTRLLRSIPNSAERLKLLEKAQARAPTSATIMAKLAAEKYLNGDVEGAIASLERAQTLGELPPSARQLQLALSIAGAQYHDAISKLEEARARDPDNAEVVRRLVRAYAADERFDASAALMRSAIERWPDDWLMAYRYNRTFLPREIDDAIFETLRREDETGQHNSAWSLQFGMAAIRHSETKIAESVLRSIKEPRNLASMARTFADTVESIDRSNLPLARFDDDESRTVRVVSSPGARATVIVFGGPTGFGYLPDAIVDRVLASIPVNAIYLHDPHGLGHLQGIPELGGTKDAELDALKGMLRQLGPDQGPVVTLGFSITGYAAMHAALAIGADATITFASPVTLAQTREGSAAAESHMGRLGLAELRAIVGGDGDLRPAMAAAASLKIWSVIGAESLPDRERTALFAALPNVSVVEMPGIDHHFASTAAIADGTLARILRGIIADSR